MSIVAAWSDWQAAPFVAGGTPPVLGPGEIAGSAVLPRPVVAATATVTGTPQPIPVSFPAEAPHTVPSSWAPLPEVLH